MMLDTSGNQCALVKTAHSPCRMEVEGYNPALSHCVLAADQFIPAQALITTHVLVNWKEEITLAEWVTRAMTTERAG